MSVRVGLYRVRNNIMKPPGCVGRWFFTVVRVFSSREYGSSERVKFDRTGWGVLTELRTVATSLCHLPLCRSACRTLIFLLKYYRKLLFYSGTFSFFAERSLWKFFVITRTGNRNFESETNVHTPNVQSIFRRNSFENTGNNGDSCNFEPLFRPLPGLTRVWNNFFLVLRVRIRFPYVFQKMKPIIWSSGRTVYVKSPVPDQYLEVLQKTDL